MLNTESRGACGLVWSAIAAICVSFLWSFLAWPSVAVMTRDVLASDVAAFAARNQVILAGLLGLGGLAAARLLDGWRQRAEHRHAMERSERRVGAVLAREAREIATACEKAARQLAARNGAPAAVVADLAAQLDPRDHMLLAATGTERARLGEGASAAVRLTRLAVRRLRDAIDTFGKDETAGARAIASRAVETCFAARGSTRVLDVLALSGAEAASRVRLIAATDDPELERMLAEVGEAKASRLQSVA